MTRFSPDSQRGDTYSGITSHLIYILILFVLTIQGFGQDVEREANQTDLKIHNELEVFLEETKLRFRVDSISVEATFDSLTSAFRGDEPHLAYIQHYRGIFYMSLRDQEQAKIFQSAALKLAQEADNNQLTAKILIELGKLESTKGNNSGALGFYFSAVKAAENAGDHRTMGACYSLMGNIYRILGEYDNAIHYITEAETQYSIIGFSVGKAWVEYSLANIYKDLELYDEALEYLYKSMAVYEVSKEADSLGVAICLDQIGDIYFNQNLFERARVYVLRSHKIHAKANNTHGRAITFKNLGKIEYKLSNFKKALDDLNQARMLKDGGKDVLVLSQIYEYIGRSLFALGHQQAGIDSAKVGLKMATEAQQRRMEKRLYGVLASMYHEYGDLETAYEYLTLQTTLTDLLAERLALVKITGMKNFHEREDRQRQLNTLNFENQFIKMKLEKQKTTQLLLGAIILSAIVFLIVLIFMYLSKRKALLLVDEQREELESLVATKNKFFSIISHDLRGPLGGTMQLMSTMIDLLPKLSNDKILELLESMNDTSKKTFQLLENLLVWSSFQTGAMQVNLVEISLAKAVNAELSVHSDKINMKSIKFKNMIEEDMMVQSDPDMLGTILRNLISNAIKFTPNGGKLTFLAENAGSQILVKVRDTGIGIPASQHKAIFSLENKYRTRGTNGEESSGLGLILVREFVEEMGGHISIESVENEGTTFTFSLNT